MAEDPKSPQDPKTREEWQEAVNAAEFFLILESCKMYGLVSGGPKINYERCFEIIQAGRARGIKPAAIEKLCEMYQQVFIL